MQKHIRPKDAEGAAMTFSKRFWKELLVTEHQLIQSVDTFDILLIQTVDEEGEDKRKAYKSEYGKST